MTDHESNQAETFTHDEIRADRACVGCGFNLYGQPVTKEPHYGLAIARCPECGTVASLQTYPVMSHWVNRFRAILAASWIIILLAVFVGSVASNIGMAKGASNLASERMSDHIGYAHFLWNAAQQEAALVQQLGNTANAINTASTTSVTLPGLPTGTTIVTSSNGTTTVNGVAIAPIAPQAVVPGQYRWTVVSEQWYDESLSQTVEDSGGLLANLDIQSLVLLVPGGLLSLFVGIFWSVSLLGTGRRKILMIPVVGCVASLILVMVISIPNSTWMFANQIAEDLYTPLVAPIYLACLLIATVIGVLIGRKVARFVVVLSLPPRSRAALSLLWTCDGLALPKPK